MDAPRGYPEAILRPLDAEQAITVERLPVGEAMAEFVDYYWYVGWRTLEPHRQQVVPLPHVHLAAEDGRLLVHGVNREPFVRTLTGVGHVLGASFHPGGFRPFLGRSVGSVSGSVVPIGDLIPTDDRATAAYILGTDDLPAMARALEHYLLALAPEPDPVVAEVRSLVATAQRERGLIRAEQLAVHAGTSLRSLQRLFTDYVGIGPKWVINRFRILEAAAAAHGGEPVDWVSLAHELGYADQAHLTRAFTEVVGTPPATYRREAGPAPSAS